jgi:15-cis-phytoene synthase
VGPAESSNAILDLKACYAKCERIARASNFYNGLRLLPSKKRLALVAVYAFMRQCDDISDNEGNLDDKREQFLQTRAALDHALKFGQTNNSILWALRDTIQKYEIPHDYFHRVIEGTEMDLNTSNFQTFEELYQYCYLVASVVGLICIEIFGYQDVQAKKHAIACGIAFQLTNILRDLSEDLERDRVYLPLEDLSRFNYAKADIRNRVVDSRFQSLMAFEVQRTKKFYEEANPLVGLLDRDSRPAFSAMLESYKTILRHIENRGYDVFRERVRLQSKDKWRIALKSLAHW